MKIISIFADRLNSFYYDDKETSDEFRRVFNQWHDPEFLMEFFTQNLEDLQSGFFGTIPLEEAALRTREEAIRLEKKLKTLSENPSASLDDIFEPLDNFQHDDPSKSKARGDLIKSWLRIYAVKVEPNVYIVTGGAIKLTKTMQERSHTKDELDKFKRCLDYLREEGITDIEGLREVYP